MKIIGVGELGAPAKNGHMAVVVMKACDLQLSASADLPLRRNFFVNPILQNRMAPSPEQRGKCVQFVESCTKRPAWLFLVGFEWTGSVGHRSKNDGAAPVVIEMHI